MSATETLREERAWIAAGKPVCVRCRDEGMPNESGMCDDCEAKTQREDAERAGEP